MDVNGRSLDLFDVLSRIFLGMTEENNEKLKMHVSRTILEGRISRIRSRNAVSPEINLQVMQTPALDGGKWHAFPRRNMFPCTN
jgi:hypothetical protein